ncbi:MAG TPA: hypothetical protein VF613_13980 [Longimicrobium sp.]|jgi:hypothetical protein
MRLPALTLLVPALGLMASCAPTHLVRQSTPAPAHALACAQASLEKMGFTGTVSKDGGSYQARRTTERLAMYNVEHVVDVSSRSNGVSRLDLSGRRLEQLVPRSTGAPALHAPYPHSLNGDAPIPTRILDPGDALRSEVEQVVRECGVSGPPRAHAAR